MLGMLDYCAGNRYFRVTNLKTRSRCWNAETKACTGRVRTKPKIYSIGSKERMPIDDASWTLHLEQTRSPHEVEGLAHDDHGQLKRTPLKSNCPRNHLI